MTFKKLRLIEICEAEQVQDTYDGPEPAWTYTGYAPYEAQTLSRCPAAWRSAVQETIATLNASLSNLSQSKASERAAWIAHLDFDFSGQSAVLDVSGDPKFNLTGEIALKSSPFGDPVIAGIARKLKQKTAFICRTCGAIKPHGHSSQRCTRCDATLRTASLLGRELRGALRSVATTAHDRHSRIKQLQKLSSLDRATVTISVSRLQEILINAARIGFDASGDAARKK